MYVAYGTLNEGIFDWKKMIVDESEVFSGSFIFTKNAMNKC